MSVYEPTPLDLILDGRVPTGLGGRWYGVYPALVADNKDPDGQGRVQISLPWAPDPAGGQYRAWARLATLMAGGSRGSWFIPDVDDEVLVAFEGGDPRRPYVVGALWNGRDQPPETMDGAGRNLRKLLRSRNGVKLTFDDSDGQEQLIIETPGGQKVTLKDGPGTVEIADSNGNTIKLEPSGVTITASARLSISASAVEISAGTVSVSAGMSRFSGVVQSDTLISNAVVGTSYTPGAGNIW
jgi:uncharacterized protein involved in type VI secretion and phage assembly